MQINYFLAPSLFSLRHNIVLSIITLAGLVLSFAALTVLNAVLSGSEEGIHSRQDTIGTVDLVVQPTGPTGNLTLQDAALLASDELGFGNISPEMHITTQVRSSTNELNAVAAGITPSYLLARDISLAEGNFISWFHVKNHDYVAVLGANVSRSLFGQLNPVNGVIYIGPNRFKVTGSLSPKNTDLLGNIDNAILIPITTANTIINTIPEASHNTQLNSLSLTLGESQTTYQGIPLLNNTLQFSHKLTNTPDFGVAIIRDIVAAQEQPSVTVTRFTTVLFVASFAIGGIGLMNMLLVSVGARRDEISIRKAVGATRWNIFVQFLIEAIILSLLSAILGIIAGVIYSGILSNSSDVATHFTISSFMQVFIISIIGGVVFGIYPAIVSSLTHPASSLRNQ